MMQEYFSRANIHPRLSLELAGDEAVKQAVIAGLGVRKEKASICTRHFSWIAQSGPAS